MNDGVAPVGATSLDTLDDLVPPAELLFDGAKDAATFKSNGEGFTRVYLKQLGQLKPNQRVLDIGSGNGQKARALAGYLNRNASYEGIDVNANGIDWCRAHYARFPNFRFQHADVFNQMYNPTGTASDANYRLPFPDNDFDVVFLCSVFTHLLEEGVTNYLREIGRVLKPGGRCLASCLLLNVESNARLAAKAANRSFPHQIGHCRVEVKDRPNAAVALDEAWVRGVLWDAGLRISAVVYGAWSGGEHLRIGSQDMVVAVKNVTNAQESARVTRTAYSCSERSPG